MATMMEHRASPQLSLLSIADTSKAEVAAMVTPQALKSLWADVGRMYRSLAPQQREHIRKLWKQWHGRRHPVFLRAMITSAKNRQQRLS